MNILDELQWRDAINQQTDEEGLRELTNEKSMALYCGIDPSGDSMHVGHLIPFMILKRFQLAGHKPVILIGGGTGSIGDPSGRNSERVLQTMEKIQENADKLSAQMRHLFEAGSEQSGIKLVNNYDWLSGLTFLDFLRDFGKEFNINTMLAKEVVSTRLETGISFTEFSYQIIQSVDFLHLFQNEEVQLQIGGSDQWGNITAGLDLIRKKEGSEAKAFGLTIPLLLKADGTKFGKSADGAIWLDPEQTTPYEFYQFWFNQDDRDVIKYLKYFTFLSKEEIDDLAEKVEKEPWKREAQRRLAQEVTKFVHGQEAVEEAERISKALFSGDVTALSVAEIEQGFKNMPSVDVENKKENIVLWLTDNGIESSRRQARQDVSSGAIRINGEKVDDVDAEIDPQAHFDGKFVIVRKGKKHYYLARVK